MRYVAFEFQNFKGVKSARLDLTIKGHDARVVTLVGLNESGKTTLLEGIDRFIAGKAAEEIGPKHIGDWQDSEPHDLIPISLRGNFNDTVSITAEVELDEDDQLAIRKAVQRMNGFRLSDLPSHVVMVNQYHFKNSRFQRSSTGWPSSLGKGRTKQGQVTRTVSSVTSNTVWLKIVETIRERLPVIWYFPNFLFDFPEQIVLTENNDETAANKLYRLLIQDILDSVGQNLSVQTHLVERALSFNSADRRSLSQLELDIGREVTRSVVQAWNELFKTSELQGKRIYVTVEAAQDDEQEGEVSVRFSLEDADGLFAIRERSLGFRWFFVYLLLTTYRGRRRANGRDIVFLFDEPASNLHTSAQGVLLDSLKALSNVSRVIYTTHSQHLINPAWLESTFVVANEGLDPAKVTSDRAASTDIKVERYSTFANRNPSRSHYFQPVLDVLEYKPSQLELVPEVIMTEGKSDYYLIRYFEAYVKSPAAGTNRLSLLPGTGAGTLITPIQMYTAWNRPFVILLDSDSAGRTAQKRYVDLFGERMLELITDIETEIGVNAKGIESILEREDMLAFQRLMNDTTTKPDKKLCARGVEHAFAVGTVVPVSPAASAKLSRLTDGLRARLRLASF